MNKDKGHLICRHGRDVPQYELKLQLSSNNHLLYTIICVWFCSVMFMLVKIVSQLFLENSITTFSALSQNNLNSMFTYELFYCSFHCLLLMAHFTGCLFCCHGDGYVAIDRELRGSTPKMLLIIPTPQENCANTVSTLGQCWSRQWVCKTVVYDLSNHLIMFLELLAFFFFLFLCHFACSHLSTFTLVTTLFLLMIGMVAKLIKNKCHTACPR